MIAFIGSVFSPYYAWARRGGGGEPGNHCALNVALYGPRAARWAMTERGRDALTRDATHLAIGPSALAWDDTGLAVTIDERAAPLPRRLRGTIRVRFAAIASRVTALDRAGRHVWSPIAPAARVDVAMELPALRWSGTAYFDTNAGDGPLEESFAAWDWSRAPLRRSTAILYEGTELDGHPFTHALRYDTEARAENFDPPPRLTLPATRWRIPRVTRAETATVLRTLEDAPFYARSVLQTRLLGQNSEAMHESLSLTRFRRPWVQAMLPFRIPRGLVWR